MEMDLSSTSEDPCEAAGSILAIEKAALETLTPPALGGNVLVLIRGEDVGGAAPFLLGQLRKSLG